jgi:hypothetical protein
MNGAFERGLKLLRPLEEDPGTSEGRAGYAAFRLRRFAEAIQWWTPTDERLGRSRLRGHYEGLLAQAKQLTTR